MTESLGVAIGLMQLEVMALAVYDSCYCLGNADAANGPISNSFREAHKA
jgi:hypothetical protein